MSGFGRAFPRTDERLIAYGQLNMEYNRESTPWQLEGTGSVFEVLALNALRPSNLTYRMWPMRTSHPNVNSTGVTFFVRGPSLTGNRTVALGLQAGNGGDAQKWRIMFDSQGVVTVRTMSRPFMCLETAISGSSSSVTLKMCNRALPAQKWRVRRSRPRMHAGKLANYHNVILKCPVVEVRSLSDETLCLSALTGTTLAPCAEGQHYWEDQTVSVEFTKTEVTEIIGQLIGNDL